MSRYHQHAALTKRRRNREAGIVYRGFHDAPARIPEIDVLMPYLGRDSKPLQISRGKPAEATPKKAGLFSRAFRAIFSRGAVRGA